MVDARIGDGAAARSRSPRSGADYGGGVLRAELVRHPSGTVVVHAVGELDDPEADALATDLCVWLDAGSEILLDLSRITFVGSGGVAALLRAQRRATERSAILRLSCGSSRPIRRALQITGTLTTFDVVDPRPQTGTGRSGALFAVPDRP